jgi:glycosyltransferase involved in cell wall biosynthesis
MRCSILAELPPPPPGSLGWPWTVEAPRLPATRPDGCPWPRISVVTPSYNQGEFIEETIRSVLLQGYPNLEYIVVDGQSTDGAVSVIRKYAPWLTFWVSEPDRGQSHAISKGLEQSTGDIFQWINSDDVLLPSALSNVGAAWTAGHAIVGPITIGTSLANADLHRNAHISALALITGAASYLQPGVWLPREGIARAGLSLDLHYAFDLDMMIRFLLGPYELRYIDSPLVFFRLHPDSKTESNVTAFDRDRLYIKRVALDLSRDPSFRAICQRALRQFVWHRFVDRIGDNRDLEVVERVRRLVMLMARRPHQRLDRYALGRVRRLILTRQ